MFVVCCAVHRSYIRILFAVAVNDRIVMSRCPSSSFGADLVVVSSMSDSPFTPAPSTDASTAAAGSVAHTGHSIPGKPATPDTTASPQTKQTKTNP